MRNDINPNSKIEAKKERTMKMTTLVKASIFAATLGFVSMLAPAARAQADAMPNADEFPFEAPQTAATAQPAHIAAVKLVNADFEGKVSLPFDVQCGAKNLKAGQYMLSVKSQGTSRVVTLHSAGQSMTMRVHQVSANRAATQSALLLHKSNEGRRLEAVYVESLNATLYLNASSGGAVVNMEQLPIS